MRRSTYRAALLFIVAALALASLMGCGGGRADRLTFLAPEGGYTTKVGVPITIAVQGSRGSLDSQFGCAATEVNEAGLEKEPEQESFEPTNLTWSVKPSDGASIDSGGRFVATKPGTYAVKADSSEAEATTQVVVTGAAAEENTVMEYAPEDRILIWKAGNDGGIEGGGGTPPQVFHDQDYYVVEVTTYHAGWGSNAPDPSGTISLKAEDGTVYGPWKTTVLNRSYWVATPNMVIPAGNYTLIDSDPSTWAQNSGSGGTGMGWAYGVLPE